MERKLYIRADMNETIATGHVMRCLSIADAASQMGIASIFLTADNNPVEMIRARGYETIVLGSDWQDKEGELWALEALIRDRNIEQLLVDSYQVTPHYLEQLKKWTKVTYLDDLNAFPYPVAQLINYANYADEFPYAEQYAQSAALQSEALQSEALQSVASQCVDLRDKEPSRANIQTVTSPKLFLGTFYVPLRSMFLHCPLKMIAEKAEKLLLMSGGSDPLDLLRTISGKIVEVYGNQFDLTIICGRFYPNTEDLQKKYAASERVHVLGPVSDMRHYLEEADIVICAGGTTLYEVSAVGTPTISFSMADNQLPNVRRFDRDGLIAYAGDGRMDDVPGQVCRLLEIYASADERKKRSLGMQQLVDGQGSRHIVEALFPDFP